jgi:nucleoside phosphorylase
MRIAFFTALKEERAALRQAWPMQDSGSLKGLPFDSGERAICFCTGMGAERMATAVGRGLHIFRPALLVLLGYSAGLRGDLSVGEVICEERSDARLVSSLREFPIPMRFGRVASSGYLHTAQDKRDLAEARPDCLVADLESEAFMLAAGDTPYLVLRAITDDLETTLPLHFDKLVTSRGFPDEGAILRKLARKPRLMPEVLGLAKASAAAQRALRQTLVDIKPLLIRRLLESNN